MALANYSDLQTSVSNWSKRSDLTSLFADFVVLAEEEINGQLDIRLQDTYITPSTVAGTETVSVPNDIINTRSLVVSSVTPNVALEYRTPDQLHKDWPYGTQSIPRAYSVIGSLFYLAPIPDAVYTLELYYKSRVPALTSTNTTNYLLTNYPNIYLFGVLKKLSEYIRDKEGFALYSDKFKAAIDAANAIDWYAGSMMRVKTDVAP
mgnify:CR=1 FL=1